MGEIRLEALTVEANRLALDGLAGDSLLHEPSGVRPPRLLDGLDPLLVGVLVVGGREVRETEERKRHRRDAVAHSQNPAFRR
jgi:hypothetical protein